MYHWPVQPEQIQQLLPEKLDIDLYKDTAWITIGLYDVKNLRLRAIDYPLYLDFPTVNLYTYIIKNGVSGLFIIKTDVGEIPTQILDQHVYHLNFPVEFDSRENQFISWLFNRYVHYEFRNHLLCRHDLDYPGISHVEVRFSEETPQHQFSHKPQLSHYCPIFKVLRWKPVYL